MRLPFRFTHMAVISKYTRAKLFSKVGNHREDENYYSQPDNLFRLISPAQQQVLFENTARAMGDAPREVKIRHIGNCLKADPAYGKGVADALGIPLSEVPA